MKRHAIWKVSVVTSPEAEEAVQECMTELLQQPAWIFTDAQTGRTTVSAYLLDPSELARFRLKQRAELLIRLRRVRASGLRPGRASVRIKKIRREDWAESWKRHFKPLEIGSRLLIKPSWSTRQPKRGEAVVVLDPGLSFGTGQHPTTRFCLEQIVGARKEEQRQSFLDIGTGSGILAIAAAKLGYKPVEALDCDSEAVRIARANAARNGVRRQIRLRRLDLVHAGGLLRGQFTVVCANLMFDLLLSERNCIVRTLARGGRIVLSGILRKQFSAVRHAYESVGLNLVCRKGEAEWASGEFVRG
jgi:ribosomal protein L11 methyltransferase